MNNFSYLCSTGTADSFLVLALKDFTERFHRNQVKYPD